MSREARREAVALRFVLQFIRGLTNVHVAEQVYADALEVVQTLFAPDRGFIALSEFVGTRPDISATQPGTLSDLIVPICVRDKIAGRIMLQYQKPRVFTEGDLALAEIIAVESGFALERLQERAGVRDVDREKDERVAMAAHELRSPMMAILGGTFLLRTRGDQELGRAVEIIERNARLQLTLLEELLHTCQMGAGKLELQIETLDLVPIVERVIEDIQATADGKNVVLRSQFQRPIMVRGDGQRLWQIFSNLVANSLRFAFPNTEIWITGAADSAGARICIQDDGLGISDDQLPHIFERFRQAHRGRSKSGGMGLGLAIVKDLVTLHGGTVTAESEGQGRGARFTVIFPSLS